MAALSTVEVERKYTVGQDTPVPPLTDLPHVERTGPPVSLDLEAVYFDTDDFTLAGHGITLRRRTGGVDAGWHLKLPAGPSARRELREPLGPDGDAVPEGLRALVRVHVRDKDLLPIAQLRTRRTATPLLGTDNVVLAEFCDDRVESEAPIGEGLLQFWREWEIELLRGSEDILAAADDLLAAVGVNRAEVQSKLARALGPAHPTTKKPLKRPKRKGPAGKVLLAYLQNHVDALKAVDPAVREDAPDSVHQLRVSARRMRSALATYRKLTDADTANRLREELQWLAGEVGRARDIEVMRDRLKALCAAEPADLLMGPVVLRITESSASQYRKARAAGLEAMSSQRYFRLLDALDAFLADPPLTQLAGKKAHKAAARLVARDIRRLVNAVSAAEEAEDAADSDEAAFDAALHEVRKSAKRLRYGAEAAAPVLGKRATKLARAAEQIQETLGILQDSVVSRGVLRELAVQAQAEGANAFSFGRLHALEQQRASEARAQFSRDWTELRPTLLRRP